MTLVAIALHKTDHSGTDGLFDGGAADGVG